MMTTRVYVQSMYQLEHTVLRVHGRHRQWCDNRLLNVQVKSRPMMQRMYHRLDNKWFGCCKFDLNGIHDETSLFLVVLVSFTLLADNLDRLTFSQTCILTILPMPFSESTGCSKNARYHRTACPKRRIPSEYQKQPNHWNTSYGSPQKTWTYTQIVSQYFGR